MHFDEDGNGALDQEEMFKLLQFLIEANSRIYPGLSLRAVKMMEVKTMANHFLLDEEQERAESSGLTHFFLKQLKQDSDAVHPKPVQWRASFLEESSFTDHFSLSVKLSTLLGILVFNTAIGIVWAYVFLVGVNGGLSEQSVANVLTISQFLGVAGAFLAAMLAATIGRTIPMGCAMLGCGLGISFLLWDISYLVYGAALYLFNFMWNVAQPYTLAVMASFSDGGKMIARGVCLQMIGFAIGPYVGAVLLRSEGPEMYSMVNSVGAALFVVGFVLFLPALWQQKGGPTPVAAEGY